MKYRIVPFCLRPGIARLAFAVLALGAGCLSLYSTEQKHHAGVRIDGYAISVAPDRLTVFDKKKNEEIEIVSEKDYTSQVGIASPVVVWYTSKDGVNHLEDIVYGSKAVAFVPADEVRQGIKRIIILAQPNDVDDTEGLVSAISQYLADNTGWFIAPTELAQEIASRNEAFTSPENAIDPTTGGLDEQRLLELQGSLMKVIARSSHTDAVFQVKIEKVKAPIRGATAAWDGTTEVVGSRATHALTPWEGIGGKAWVYAATADMYFWSNRGKLLWRNRRGFATLAVQGGFGGKYRERPLNEIYGKQDVMHRWLADALGPLAPAVSGWEAAPLPVPPEVQQQVDKARQSGGESR